MLFSVHSWESLRVCQWAFWSVSNVEAVACGVSTSFVCYSAEQQEHRESQRTTRTERPANQETHQRPHADVLLLQVFACLSHQGHIGFFFSRKHTKQFNWISSWNTQDKVDKTDEISTVSFSFVELSFISLFELCRHAHGQRTNNIWRYVTTSWVYFLLWSPIPETWRRSSLLLMTDWTDTDGKWISWDPLCFTSLSGSTIRLCASPSGSLVLTPRGSGAIAMVFTHSPLIVSSVNCYADDAQLSISISTDTAASIQDVSIPYD